MERHRFPGLLVGIFVFVLGVIKATAVVLVTLRVGDVLLRGLLCWSG